jgi:hypothetical protein
VVTLTTCRFAVAGLHLGQVTRAAQVRSSFRRQVVAPELVPGESGLGRFPVAKHQVLHLEGNAVLAANCEMDAVVQIVSAPKATFPSFLYPSRAEKRARVT